MLRAQVHLPYIDETRHSFNLTIFMFHADECTDGSIQLVGGSNSNEGRVEVCVNGQWGTVCDDGWNADSAHVACQSLGIGGGTAVYTSIQLHIYINTYTHV